MGLLASCGTIGGRPQAEAGALAAEKTCYELPDLAECSCLVLPAVVGNQIVWLGQHSYYLSVVSLETCWDQQSLVEIAQKERRDPWIPLFEVVCFHDLIPSNGSTSQ